MMNSVNAIGVNNSNYQMSFKAKGDKAAYRIIDQAHELAKEIGRPLAEKKENMIRRYVSRFMEIFKKENNSEYKEYKQKIEKAFKDGMLDADHAGALLSNKSSEANELIEITDKAFKQARLEELKKVDPELYKEVLRRYAEEKVATMTTMEMIEEIVKNIFKKS